MEAIRHVGSPLRLLESVRCLECGEIYAKPVAGGTVQKNPGCPLCGYVGWIPITRPGEREAPHHSAVGRPQLHDAHRH
jgi:hypothetical protein